MEILALKTAGLQSARTRDLKRANQIWNLSRPKKRNKNLGYTTEGKKGSEAE
jgi:hypothetical protein